MSNSGQTTIHAFLQKHSHEENEHDPHDWCPALDRRAAVRLLSLSALAAATGCTATSINGKTTTSTATTATTTTLSSSVTSVAANVDVTLTAVVSPTAATGTVTFYNGTTSLGSATLSSGVATLTTLFSTAGTESLTATYAGSSTYAASTSAAVSLTVTSTAACSVTLEGEEGPYFVDDSATGYNRSNILTNLDGTDAQTGVPLTLTMYVYDAKNSCAAIQNVQVDIWHCNAAGIYSAESVESTSSQSWLRGYQLTDSTGKVSFTTILPGWYSGRTTHIHFRLRSTYDSTDTSGSNTIQIFFDQTLIDTLATSVSPYSAEGTNPTTNASDRVYSQQEDGTTLVTMTGSTSAGYTTSFNVYLPI
jgi:protocatechuate 3,4-dioxygenase beta subunit